MLLHVVIHKFKQACKSKYWPIPLFTCISSGYNKIARLIRRSESNCNCIICHKHFWQPGARLEWTGTCRSQLSAFRTYFISWASNYPFHSWKLASRPELQPDLHSCLGYRTERQVYSLSTSTYGGCLADVLVWKWSLGKPMQHNQTRKQFAMISFSSWEACNGFNSLWVCLNVCLTQWVLLMLVLQLISYHSGLIGSERNLCSVNIEHVGTGQIYLILHSSNLAYQTIKVNENYHIASRNQK